MPEIFDPYPDPGCGKHTGRASNRCLLAEGHDGRCDDDPNTDLLQQIATLTVELTEYRREHYRDHMWSHFMDQSDVRCYGCNLRYAEREDYSCGYDGQPGAPGGPHTYDADELAAAMTCDDPIHQYASQFEAESSAP